MLVRKCISGEKSDIVLSNHNYGRRQIKAKWNNEEFGYFNWRASVASETLTGVKMKKLGMFIYLYICLDVRMSFCTLTLAFLC